MKRQERMKGEEAGEKRRRGIEERRTFEKERG